MALSLIFEMRYFTACNTTSAESDIEATGTSVSSGKMHQTTLFVFSNLQMKSLKPKCMLFLSVVVNRSELVNF